MGHNIVKKKQQQKIRKFERMELVDFLKEIFSHFHWGEKDKIFIFFKTEWIGFPVYIY